MVNKEKTVFIGFDPKSFNFTNVSNKEVLFHINLDEEEIISKENVHFFKTRLIKSLRSSSTRRKTKKTKFRLILIRF